MQIALAILLGWLPSTVIDWRKKTFLLVPLRTSPFSVRPTRQAHRIAKLRRVALHAEEGGIIRPDQLKGRGVDLATGRPGIWWEKTHEFHEMIPEYHGTTPWKIMENHGKSPGNRSIPSLSFTFLYYSFQRSSFHISRYHAKQVEEDRLVAACPPNAMHIQYSSQLDSVKGQTNFLGSLGSWRVES